MIVVLIIVYYELIQCLVNISLKYIFISNIFFKFDIVKNISLDLRKISINVRDVNLLPQNTEVKNRSISEQIAISKNVSLCFQQRNFYWRSIRVRSDIDWSMKTFRVILNSRLFQFSVCQRCQCCKHHFKRPFQWRTPSFSSCPFSMTRTKKTFPKRFRSAFAQSGR